jgi:hypothetical protein
MTKGGHCAINVSILSVQNSLIAEATLQLPSKSGKIQVKWYSPAEICQFLVDSLESHCGTCMLLLTLMDNEGGIEE